MTTFPYIKVRQPIGDFYIASIRSDVLTRISFTDVRRLQRDRDVEQYLGIQRPLDDRRVTALREYVKAPDATFPTSIILAIDERCVQFDGVSDDAGMMTLLPYEGDDEDDSIAEDSIAKVLDGQHRIAGLERFAGEVFEVSVSIFIGADISDQAAIFATVNLEQTRVSKSLAYDLLALARTRSPEKTCHESAVVIDSTERSAYYKMIKRLGVATPGRGPERISQATFVKGLVAFITSDSFVDRVDLLKGRRLTEASGSLLKRRPFRNHFIREQDARIVVSILNYFDAVRATWPEAWTSDERGVMIARTNGYLAFMRFLRWWLGEHDETEVSRDRMIDVLRPIRLRDFEFTTDVFPPGSSGQSKLFRSLMLGQLAP